MKEVQGRMWREGDQMRQRMGISLASELDPAAEATLIAENKRDRSGSLEAANRLLSGLSLSSNDRKSSSSSASSAGIASSSKPVLNSRAPVANGRRSLDGAASASPEDDGQVTQGDMLRQRRTHGHHLTPAEAKAASSATQSKGVSSSSSRPLVTAAPPAKPTTRSQISRFLGK
jgi:hypothetical protein